ncbi:MAG: response regulator [Spirochaetales bacterium]|nr:response regulator [Spirochaetales bacterium]MCF7938292.1 response regulator [Spirochaetales bacterium]
MDAVGEIQVLLVDDEQEILRALRRRLRRECFTLLTAGSAEEALKVLEGNDVNVILSDARMPGVNGIELLEKIKWMYPEIVRIIITGYVETNGLIQAINKGGVFRLVTKPWDEERLREIIYEAIEHFRTMQQNARDMEPIIKHHRYVDDGDGVSRDDKVLEVTTALVEEVRTPVACLDEEFRIVCANHKFRLAVIDDIDGTLPDNLSSLLEDGAYEELKGNLVSPEKQLLVSLHIAGRNYQSRFRLLRQQDPLFALLFIDEEEGKEHT